MEDEPGRPCGTWHCCTQAEQVGCYRSMLAACVTHKPAAASPQASLHAKVNMKHRSSTSSSSRQTCQHERSPRAQAWPHPSTAPRGPPRQTRSCRPAASPGRRTWTPAWFGGQSFGSEQTPGRRGSRHRVRASERGSDRGRAAQRLAAAVRWREGSSREAGAHLGELVQAGLGIGCAVIPNAAALRAAMAGLESTPCGSTAAAAGGRRGGG